MKKTWLLTATICLLIIAGGGAVVLWPRTIPFDKCSEAYKTYANNPSVEASFIKDFRINDSVFVDVTLLEAADSIGWNTLWHDFCLPDLTPEMKRVIENKKDRVFARTTKKNSYCETVDETTQECDIIAVLFAKRTICVFHIANLEERHAVLYFNYDKSSNNNINLP